jgi:formate dehydrogenase maturation protein FdhE
MTFLSSGKVNYRARIDRAFFLAKEYPFANEVLQFYSGLAKFQQRLYERLPKEWGKQAIAPSSGDLRSELNLPVLLPHFKDFLSLIAASAPGPLAAEAKLLESQGMTAWGELLEAYWRDGLHEAPRDGSVDPETDTTAPLKEFLSRAFLQPYAEFVVSAMLPPALSMLVCRCPRCNSLPLLGLLRPEGDGGKRFLQCSFCSQEWEFRRIFCAFCGEEREDKLPVYVAEEFAHVRVEACDTCKHFLRTIDLTKDGHAVPLVDDLAAMPLSFWTEEHGYARIQANLLGT